MLLVQTKGPVPPAILTTHFFFLLKSTPVNEFAKLICAEPLRRVQHILTHERMPFTEQTVLTSKGNARNQRVQKGGNFVTPSNFMLEYTLLHKRGMVFSY